MLGIPDKDMGGKAVGGRLPQVSRTPPDFVFPSGTHVPEALKGENPEGLGQNGTIQRS